MKCSAHLADILQRASQRDPLSRTIGPAHHGELHETVVHAVITLQRGVPHAHHYRTMITRAYAAGVDRTTRFPTKECVRSICLVLDTAVSGLRTDD